MKKSVLLTCLPLVIATTANPETPNLYGMPGQLEMPSAQVFPDGEIVASASGFPGQERVTLAFQASPRLTLAFRYSRIADFQLPGGDDLYDRSFDVAYQVLTETARRPALTIGMRDVIGTGIYSGEYIVASKTFGPDITLSGGLGWGRLGTRGEIGTPFGDRPPYDFGEGGRLAVDQWFRGPAAPFAGVTWQINERWSAMAEYSSDALTEEEARGLEDPSSPLNIGVSYSTPGGNRFSLAWLHGDKVGFGVHFALNPKRAVADTGREAGPRPITRRNRAELNDLSWITDGVDAQAAAVVAPVLEKDGIKLRRLRLDARTARAAIENTRYPAHPQAIGRTARILANAMPTSVSHFEITLIDETDLALSTTRIARDDLERLEFATAEALAARVDISDPTYPLRLPEEESRFTWALLPYATITYFDPDEPARLQGGLRLSASYDLPMGLVAAGEIRGRLFGNRDDNDVTAPGALPQVRTDGAAFAEPDIVLQNATLSHYGKLAPDVYTRVSAGYLERAYAGVATEVLWKPADSRLGFGAELAYAKKRDYEGGLGLADYDTLTGFLSTYYEFGNGLLGQIDVGRYLAGDVGATVSLSREFNNGWEVGAFVTRTDASFEDFGEGSFDKGIRVTIPLSWATGQPTREKMGVKLRSLTRDGGARLDTGEGLYPRVREGHEAELKDRWGRFWR